MITPKFTYKQSPTAQMTPQLSQAMDPTVYCVAVMMDWWHAGQVIDTGVSPNTIGVWTTTAGWPEGPNAGN